MRGVIPEASGERPSQGKREEEGMLLAGLSPWAECELLKTRLQEDKDGGGTVRAKGIACAKVQRWEQQSKFKSCKKRIMTKVYGQLDGRRRGSGGGAQQADHEEALVVFSFKTMMRQWADCREGTPLRPTIWWGQGCEM